jgi:hypothetical protein
MKCCRIASHARTREGVSVGTVVVDDDGTSWGYGPFLRRHGGESGDALTISFDLVAETAILSLGDDEMLVDE